MNTKLLEKYANKKTNGTGSTADEAGGEEADDYSVFGWLRGIRDKALMLELRKKDGSVKAVGYAWLHEVEFDPTEGITLHVIGQTIRIIGRNLNSEYRPNVTLLSGITRQRVPFIQEADQATLMNAKESDTVIEKIEW